MSIGSFLSISDAIAIYLSLLPTFICGKGEMANAALFETVLQAEQSFKDLL